MRARHIPATVTRRLGLLALSWAVVGCASSTNITVHSSLRTNDGRPLYMMVRAWDGKPAVSDRYQEVAAKVFAEPADPSVVATRAILPGEDKTTITFDDAAAKEFIVYFFFTDPAPNWQLPFRKPLPAEIDIDLGRHQVDRVRTRPR